MGEQATNKPPRPVRKRPIMQAVWLTEDEWRHVQDRMALTRSKSFGAFARAALLDGAVTVHEALDVSALRPELSRIGNNVNQIARQANTDMAVSRADLQEVRSLLAQLQDKLNELGGGR